MAATKMKTVITPSEYYVARFFAAGSEIPSSCVYVGPKADAKAKAKELNAQRAERDCWMNWKARRAK